MEEERIRQIALGLISGLGPVNSKKLIAACGGIHEVFEMSKSDLIAISGMSQSIANEIVNRNTWMRAEQELKHLEQQGITPMFYLDNNYPLRLKNCADAPLMLYSKGNVNANVKRVVGIVGTRRCTTRGVGICEKLVHDLSKFDPLIVSGLAFGIDISAHRAALNQGLQTIACLGHGLKRIYPADHGTISRRMQAHGGLLSEYLYDDRPDPRNFPQRNRIIAGMVDALVVIESSVKGGSIITARLANSYSREVFAVPGRIQDNMSRGCLQLIQDNRAHLIQTAEDIERIMSWESESTLGNQLLLFEDLSEMEQQVVEEVQNRGRVHIDDLAQACKSTVSEVSSILLTLEFKGVLRTLPGKHYTTV